MNFKKLIQFPILQSRWILLIFYYGLVVAQAIYCVQFITSLYHVATHFLYLTHSDVMLAVLELVDIVLIGNLIQMAIRGGYSGNIEKVEHDQSEQISAGGLKIKMGTSLVMVSGINLLQTFVSPLQFTMKEIVVKCTMHLIFLVSAIGLAYIEHLHEISNSKQNPH